MESMRAAGQLILCAVVIVMMVVLSWRAGTKFWSR